MIYVQMIWIVNVYLVSKERSLKTTHPNVNAKYMYLSWSVMIKYMNNYYIFIRKSFDI